MPLPVMPVRSSHSPFYCTDELKSLRLCYIADALQVGKIKNKVLKLTGEVQGINIKIAQAKAKGEDTSDLEDSLAAEQYVSFLPCLYPDLF